LASEAKGYLRVPVWVDDGVVKPLVDDNGRLPIQLGGSGITLEVDVTASVIPTGAASAANQATLITAIQSIQNLVGALHDVGVDELDVNLKTSDITLGVTESSPLTSLQSQLYGWDLTNWRKNPLVWGYTSRYAEYKESIDVAAGSHGLDFSTVPEGEVRVITSIAAWSAQANITRIEIAMTDSSVYYCFRRAVPSAAGLTVEFQGCAILKKDDIAYCMFVDCALNDDIYASALGYTMKVNE